MKPALAGLALLIASDSALAQTPPLHEEVRTYRSVGRIQWRLPEMQGARCGFAVPHFTVGPRIQCAFASGATSEISVQARDLSRTLEARRAEFLDEMHKRLPLARESAVDLRTRGGGPSVYYAALTHRDPARANPRLTRGFYLLGSALIQFELESGTASERELEQVIGILLSAQALDGRAFLAWKLDDYKSVCAQEHPDLAALNDAALSGSPFARVDWLAHLLSADGFSSREAALEQTGKARSGLHAQLKQEGEEYFRAFCEYYPLMVLEAERDAPDGRKRGMLGVILEAEPAPGGGARIRSLVPGGAAARAGMREGDLILQAQGQPVSRLMDLLRVVSPLAGRRIDVLLQRGAERSTVSLTADEAKDD